MGARGSSGGTGALTRDTGGTTTGAGTLRSRASIGTGGSRTASLAGGSDETTPLVVGSGAGGSSTVASPENVSTAGGSGVADSFENASAGAMSLTTLASLDASVGTISLTVGNGAGGPVTNGDGGSSTVVSRAAVTALTVGGTVGSRVATCLSR